jgi:hypothetical protein
MKENNIKPKTKKEKEREKRMFERNGMHQYLIWKKLNVIERKNSV